MVNFEMVSCISRVLAAHSAAPEIVHKACRVAEFGCDPLMTCPICDEVYGKGESGE